MKNRKELREPIRLRHLPRPGRPVEDRRTKRSGSAAEALTMALSSAAEDLDAVLIADDYGMLVSQSETDLDLAMLAAVTPIVARGKAKATIKRAGEPRELTVCTLEVYGERLHVAVLGGAESARTASLARSVAATERILAA